MKRRKIPYPKIFSTVLVVILAAAGSTAACMTARYSVLVLTIPALLLATRTLCSIYGRS